MSKLHELLAVRPDVKKRYDELAQRAIHDFANNAQLFQGRSKIYTPKIEDGLTFPGESEEVADSVAERISSVASAMAEMIDVITQQESTNASGNAVAYIEVDEYRLLNEGLPATALLNLEGRLQEFKKVLTTIPVNNPKVKWEFNENMNLWASPPETTHKYEKVQEPIVLYPATTEHPAQTELVTRNALVGEYETVRLTGLISWATKREWVARVDMLILAVKQARQRANDTEVVKINVGDTIMDFIFRTE